MRSNFNNKRETRAIQTVTVKSIRRITLDKPVPVCDLEVPKYHNFALASGPYVHNCVMAKAPHHEIIKLRGVGVNAQRAPSSKVLANPEIKLIIRALGIKPRETDLSKMRTGCVTILTDADQDGKHIESLLLAFFKIYYPEIIRQGKLKFIIGPLYIGQLKDTRKFGDTREEVLEQFEKKQQGQVRLTRLKGWAEATAEQLEEIAFNPETRRIGVFTMNEEDELMIERVMGKDVSHRKEMLTGDADDAETETDD